MDGLTEGRIVHYVMPNGQHRPAIVVQVWDYTGPSGTSNLQVFTDGPNDKPFTPAEKQKNIDFGIDSEQVAHGHLWRTSIMYSEEHTPGTWHWIEKA